MLCLLWHCDTKIVNRFRESGPSVVACLYCILLREQGTCTFVHDNDIHFASLVEEWSCDVHCNQMVNQIMHNG